MTPGDGVGGSFFTGSASTRLPPSKKASYFNSCNKMIADTGRY